MLRTLALALCTLAISAHAEDYCFGFLNSHPERKPIPEDQANEIQKGHLAHMSRMAAQGHLLAAGPMMTEGGPRGIVIYRCQSLEEPQKWTALDPAVQNKRLTLEVYRWRGPENLGEPLASKLKSDPNTKYEMVRLPLIVLRTTAKPVDSAPREVLMSHVERTKELEASGRLRAAGPFVGANGEPGSVPGVIGIFIFAAIPLEEARSLAEQDPMVKNGYATVQPYLWMVADEVIPKP
jgi:uncharacterized protein YciI